MGNLETNMNPDVLLKCTSSVRALTNGQPGDNTDPDVFFMDTPQLLPHIEQGRIVVDEGANLMHNHQEYGHIHRPGVWQGTVHIACTTHHSIVDVQHSKWRCRFGAHHQKDGHIHVPNMWQGTIQLPAEHTPHICIWPAKLRSEIWDQSSADCSM